MGGRAEVAQVGIVRRVRQWRNKGLVERVSPNRDVGRALLKAIGEHRIGHDHCIGFPQEESHSRPHVFETPLDRRARMPGEQVVIEVVNDLCADGLDRCAEFSDLGEFRAYWSAALQDDDMRPFACKRAADRHSEPIGERAVTIRTEKTNFRTCPGRAIGRRLRNEMQPYHSAPHKASKSLRAAPSGVSVMAVSMPARRTVKRNSASTTSL